MGLGRRCENVSWVSMDNTLFQVRITMGSGYSSDVCSTVEVSRRVACPGVFPKIILYLSEHARRHDTVHTVASAVIFVISSCNKL